MSTMLIWWKPLDSPACTKPWCWAPDIYFNIYLSRSYLNTPVFVTLLDVDANFYMLQGFNLALDRYIFLAHQTYLFIIPYPLSGVVPNCVRNETSQHCAWRNCFIQLISTQESVCCDTSVKNIVLFKMHWSGSELVWITMYLCCLCCCCTKVVSVLNFSPKITGHALAIIQLSCQQQILLFVKHPML
jgi:hypothetical protein